MSEVPVYTSLEEVPVDEWNGFDEDATALEGYPEGLTAHTEEERVRSLGVPATGTYLPFKREVKLGTIGKDVLAIKRALSSAGFGVWGGWGSQPRLFGPYARRNLINFQKKHGLKADGIYGLATHRKLAPYFDSYGRWLLGQTKIIVPATKREVIVSTAMLGWQKRTQIHYTQSWLRMQGVKQKIKPPAVPSWEDCSSFATWCYWVAGARDPNGFSYNGLGYTGTLANHGWRTRSPQPGDLVFYGSFPHSHVTIYVGFGKCVSHGSEVGPLYLPYNYRPVNQIRSYIT